MQVEQEDQAFAEGPAHRFEKRHLMQRDAEPRGTDHEQGDEGGDDQAERFEQSPAARGRQRGEDAPRRGAGEQAGGVGKPERRQRGITAPAGDEFRPIAHDEGKGKGRGGDGVEGSVGDGNAAGAGRVGEAVEGVAQERRHEHDAEEAAGDPGDDGQRDAAMDGDREGEESQADRGGEAQRRKTGEDFVSGNDGHPDDGVKRAPLEDAERQPRQRAGGAEEIDPARADGEDVGAEDEAEGVEREVKIGQRGIEFLAEAPGEQREADEGEEQEEERDDVDDPEAAGGVSEQRGQDVKRMPVERAHVAQQVVVAAEDVIGEEGRLSFLEAPADFGQDGEVAGEAIIGEEVAGTPELEEGEEGGEEGDVAPEQLPETAPVRASIRRKRHGADD